MSWNRSECKPRKCKTEDKELPVGAAYRELTHFFREGSSGHSVLQATDIQDNPVFPHACSLGRVLT